MKAAIFHAKGPGCAPWRLIPVKALAAIGGSAPMPVHNAEIAVAFDHLADLLEIEGANPFRIRAYRRAARDRT